MKNIQKGFSLTELLVVVVIIGIIAAIAIPNLLSSRRSANEASAISTMRMITTTEAAYANSMGKGNYATLTELGAAGLIDTVIGCSTAICTKSGYRFSSVATDVVPNVSPAYFDVKGEPVNWTTDNNATGSRSFYSNEVGVIFFTPTGTAPSGTSAIQRRPLTGSPIS